MHPHAPSPGIHGGATGAESPAGVGVTGVITRSGAARFDSAGEHPALGRGVATFRREQGPRSRNRSRARPQQGVPAGDTCRVFGTTPCNDVSPRVGLFSDSARFQAEIDGRFDSETSSFVAPAGTKYGAANPRNKQYYDRINARAGPASVETCGLSQKDSSLGLESWYAGAQPPYMNPSQRLKVVRVDRPTPLTEVVCGGTQ